MAHLVLPELPKGARVAPRVLRFGTDLTAVLGGSMQRLVRVGARYQVEVTLPRLDVACARTWLAARARAEAEGLTVRLPMPQLGDGAGITGRSAVSGSGASLTVDDAEGIVPGLFFSFVVADHAYFHQVTRIVGDTLSVAPLLRADPAGKALTFDAPVLEGFADELAWDMERLRFVGQAFTLTEDR